ncbi:MAG: hypothetical protein LRY69_04695 [Gammaproteobacteria bacterium]|nr:hypothetical protein [Gammaproteobacteria bacterium]
MKENEKVSFVDFLLQTGFIRREQYSAIDLAQKDGNFSDLLLNHSSVLTPMKIDELFKQFSFFPQTNLSDLQPSVASILPESIVNQYGLLVFREQDGCFHVALSNPLVIESIDSASTFLKKKN